MGFLEGLPPLMGAVCRRAPPPDGFAARPLPEPPREPGARLPVPVPPARPPAAPSVPPGPLRSESAPLTRMSRRCSGLAGRVGRSVCRWVGPGRAGRAPRSALCAPLSGRPGPRCARGSPARAAEETPSRAGPGRAEPVGGRAGGRTEGRTDGQEDRGTDARTRGRSEPRGPSGRGRRVQGRPGGRASERLAAIRGPRARAPPPARPPARPEGSSSPRPRSAPASRAARAWTRGAAGAPCLPGQPTHSSGAPRTCWRSAVPHLHHPDVCPATPQGLGRPQNRGPEAPHPKFACRSLTHCESPRVDPAVHPQTHLTPRLLLDSLRPALGWGRRP